MTRSVWRKEACQTCSQACLTEGLFRIYKEDEMSDTELLEICINEKVYLEAKVEHLLTAIKKHRLDDWLTRTPADNVLWRATPDR